MTVKLLPVPQIQFLNSNGDPLAGGKVYTYEPGTTTDKTTWSDYDKSTANANPVVLDSEGRAQIYIEGDYTVKVTDADGNLVYTQDYVNPQPTATTTDPNQFNLVPNGSFELDSDEDGSDPDEWTITDYVGGGSHTLVNGADDGTGSVSHGGQALKISSTASKGAWAVTNDYIPVTDTFPLVVSFDIKNSASCASAVTVDWYDSNNGSNGTGTIYSDTENLSSGWVHKETWITPPAGSAKCKIKLDAITSDATESVFFDNVILRQMFSSLTLSEHVTLEEISSSPSTTTNEGAVYVKNDGTQSELYFRSESDATEVKLTQGLYVNSGRVLLEEYTADDSDTSFEMGNGYIDSTYDIYEIEIIGLTFALAQTGGEEIRIQFFNGAYNSGSGYWANGKDGAYDGSTPTNDHVVLTGATGNQTGLDDDEAAGGTGFNLCSTLRCYNMSSTSLDIQGFMHSLFRKTDATGRTSGMHGEFVVKTSGTAVTKFKIYTVTGTATFTTGTVRLWGVRNA